MGKGQLVTIKEWSWAEVEAQQAFQALRKDVQEEFEEKLGQRVGERHKVGDRREGVLVAGRLYTVFTFLDADGTLWVTVPPIVS